MLLLLEIQQQILKLDSKFRNMKTNYKHDSKFRNMFKKQKPKQIKNMTAD